MNQQLVSYIRQQLRANEQRESIMNYPACPGLEIKRSGCRVCGCGERADRGSGAARRGNPSRLRLRKPSRARPKLSKVSQNYSKPSSGRATETGSIFGSGPEPTPAPSSAPDSSSSSNANAAARYPGRGFRRISRDEQFNESAAGQPSLLKSILAFVGLGFWRF